jgi:hypothetical protein
MNKKIIYVLSFFTFSLLVVFFCITGYHNRFSADDYCALASVNKIGAINCIKSLYMTSEGSFGQGILLYSFAKIFNATNNLFVFNVFTFLFLFFSIYINIKELIKKYFDTNSILYSLLITGALLNAWFFNYIYSNDTWFWFTGSLSYITPISILLYALYFYFFKKNYINLSISVILFILFAGVRFNFTISVISLISSTIIILYIIDKRKIKTLIPMLIFVSIGAIIYLIAPGNGHRRSTQVDNHLWAIITNTFGGYASLLKNLWLRKIPYQIIYLAPLTVVGLYFQPFKKHNISLLNILAISVFSLSAVILSHMLVLYLATGLTSNYSVRVLLLISLLFTVFNSLLVIYIGEKLYQQEKVLFLVSGILISASIAYSGYFFYKKIKISSVYATKFDERMELIKEKNTTNDTVIFVPKLPDSGFIHTAELAKISEPKEVWRNECFCEYYNIGFKVYSTE